MRTSYAAAYFAEALRESRYGREVRLADLAAIAAEAGDAARDPDVRELADLISQADKLIRAGGR
jgi:Ca-activated chloride channel family protein